MMNDDAWERHSARFRVLQQRLFSPERARDALWHVLEPPAQVPLAALWLDWHEWV